MSSEYKSLDDQLEERRQNYISIAGNMSNRELVENHSKISRQVESVDLDRRGVSEDMLSILQAELMKRLGS